eukprot:GEMP01028902.1.p1 GENE.GEMP01028902.1~~GEMP01028902.1.p1  ORF type:complete len:661 (-),score=138.47 GEMP01028902.1:271-2253(-)
MFHGCSILLAPFGDLTKVRRDIIGKNIKKHGGTVVTNVGEATHVLVSSGRVFEVDCPLRVRIRQHAWGKVVLEAWYKESVSLNQRADEERFRPWQRSRDGLSLPQKRSREDDAISIASTSSQSSAAPRQHNPGPHLSPEKVGRLSLPESSSTALPCQSNAPHSSSSRRSSPTTLVSSPLNGGTSSHDTSSVPLARESQAKSKVEDGRSVAPIHASLSPYQQHLMRTASATFACQKVPQPRDEECSNQLNAELIAQFTSLADNVDQKAGTDQFRARANRKTAAILSALDYTVTLDNLHTLKTKIGHKSMLKIEEFLSTGCVRQVQLLQTDPKTQALKELQKIWGVGLATATQWYASGITTIDDVRKQPVGFLNTNQKIGLRFLEDFQLKLSRAEVEAIFTKVKEYSQGLNFEKIECVGSYRRKLAQCGDVDILICSTLGSSIAENHAMLRKLVDALESDALITHRLTNYQTHDKDSEHATATFMGVFRLTGSPYHRRIDIKLWPREQYAYALLHFTGNGHFNRSMRLFAQKLGYSLSDHGLCAVHRDAKTKTKIAMAKSVPAQTEEDVFAHLGLKYMPPEQRTVGAELAPSEVPDAVFFSRVSESAVSVETALEVPGAPDAALSSGAVLEVPGVQGAGLSSGAVLEVLGAPDAAIRPGAEE